MSTREHDSGRTPRDYLAIGLKGICMGAADVVPGVSGGTMAFITGIYEELIQSIRSVDLQVLRLVLRLRIGEACLQVRWQFLAALLSGIFLAIFSLARAIAWVLDHHPVLIWAFFFGLVLASVVAVRRRVTRWDAATAGSTILATVAAYFLVGLVPVETPDSRWFVFLCGAIAICAMILPGISGSFMLVLLGKYQHMLGAVNNRDFLTLVAFGAGAVVGITSFARVLGWVFRKYHDLTVAALTGLMLGSLRKVWPWKETISTFLNRHGKEIPLEQTNVLPDAFSTTVAAAIGLAALGFVLVLALERVAGRLSGPESTEPGQRLSKTGL